MHPLVTEGPAEPVVVIEKLNRHFLKMENTIDETELCQEIWSYGPNGNEFNWIASVPGIYSAGKYIGIIVGRLSPTNGGPNNRG